MGRAGGASFERGFASFRNNCGKKLKASRRLRKSGCK